VDHPVSGGVLHPQHNIGPIVHPPTTMNEGYAQAVGRSRNPSSIHSSPAKPCSPTRFTRLSS
jgi:hypothetical protein